MATLESVLADFPSSIPDQPELVKMEREGDLVWLTISRVEVMNCLSFPTLKRFRSLLAELREDLSIRCILITGEGERAFCAGADLKERKSMDPELVPTFVMNIRRLMDKLNARPAAQRAHDLSQSHAFQTEMDDTAMRNMYPQIFAPATD